MTRTTDVVVPEIVAQEVLRVEDDEASRVLSERSPRTERVEPDDLGVRSGLGAGETAVLSFDEAPWLRSA